MKTHIAVAISGGVDSLMAAVLLKESGYRVTGIHFNNGFESPNACNSDDWSPPEKHTNPLIVALGDRIGIPVICLDLTEFFQKTVVDYFVTTYRNGCTPNPCMICNASVKFGVLLQKALHIGASGFATGHYARISADSGGRFQLKKGIDPAKDQSYFLARLTSDQLRRSCFPLGEYTKREIRQMAAKRSLHPVTAGESQDICFIRNATVADFLTSVGRISSKPGPIQDTSGKRIGSHNGLHLFTIGQRKGINCPAPQPYYVCKLDIAGNTLIVGCKEEIYSKELLVTDINWITPAPSSPIKVATRVRYRHTESPSTLYPLDRNRARVVFKYPQKALTPGQGAVFYCKDTVLGGGWIDTVIPSAQREADNKTRLVSTGSSM